MKDYQRDAEEARQAKEELQSKSHEQENRLRSLEQKMVTLQEQLDASEKARRTAEAERDELNDQLQGSASRGLLAEERRRLELQIARLQEELDEESNNMELTNDKLRKAQQQVWILKLLEIHNGGMGRGMERVN